MAASIPGPTELTRASAWPGASAAGCCFRSCRRSAPPSASRLRQRVAAELKTTFASHYTQVVSLPRRCSLPIIAAYAKRATGEKYLINPNKAG